MRYLIFSQKAEAERFPNIARLFKAISHAEQVHATNHFNALSLIRGSLDNLQMAIDGETYEVNEMYPAFNAVAQLQSEKGAMQSINYAFQAEKIHATMYQNAKQAADNRKDIQLDAMFICDVCGHTVEGEAPGRCPICGASKDKFRKF